MMLRGVYKPLDSPFCFSFFKPTERQCANTTSFREVRHGAGGSKHSSPLSYVLLSLEFQKIQHRHQLMVVSALLFFATKKRAIWGFRKASVK